MSDHNIHLMCKKKNLHGELVKKNKIISLCIESTSGPILLGSAGYRKGGNTTGYCRPYKLNMLYIAACYGPA